MSTVSKVPFSPVPGHIVDIKHRASDTWTHRGVPLMELAEDNFRLSSLRLVHGLDDEARQYAMTGLAMEDAYVRRARDEYRREQEAAK